MAIYLIRHGQTIWNAAAIVQLPETPLSARGREQARRLGARLRRHNFGALMCSDYARARETAAALAAASAASGGAPPPQIETLLRERNFGALRGRSYQSMAADGIEMFADGYTPPEGESWPQFHARVDAAWARVTAAAAVLAGGDLAVVTHGLVCESVFRRKAVLAPGVPAPESHGAWANTGITVLEAPADAAAADAPWIATLVNCARHLDGMDEAPPSPGDAAAAAAAAASASGAGRA